MNFDLSKIETTKTAEAGATLDVIHPTTGEKLGIKITLAGKDSSIYRQAEARVARKIQAKRRREADPEEIEAASIEIMAACTLSWSGVVVDGEEWPCTKDKAVELYTRWPTIKEQVSLFIADRANYILD